MAYANFLYVYIIYLTNAVFVHTITDISFTGWVKTEALLPITSSEIVPIWTGEVSLTASRGFQDFF